MILFHFQKVNIFDILLTRKEFFMLTKSFTTEPVSKLFFRYLIPSICGTMVTSIYVLADTIIIGRGIGIDAMAALNIVLPLFNIFFGTGLLFGVGGSVLMSIARGKGDPDAGQRYFSTSLFLNAVMSILYMIVFLTFMEEIARFLGATDTTMPYIMAYTPPILWGIGFFSFSSFLQTFVRNDGAPTLAMAAVISGGVLNVILDIVFVYPLKMGMMGAALASVIGSFTTTAILLLHFFSKSNGLHFSMKGISLSLCTDIFKNGFTSFLVDISSGIVMFIFNLQILKYIGDIGVSMYGVITNTAIVVTCLCNGVNQAAQPIISTNHGAGLHDRIHIVRKLGIRTSLAIGLSAAALGLAFPNMFTYIFLHPNPEILALSPSAVRTYFTGFSVTGLNMFIIGYFQSTAKPHLSLLLCLLRGCVLSILFVYVLPPFLDVTGIWASVPLAEFITLLAAIYFLIKNTREARA